MSKDLVEVVRCKDCKYCVVEDEYEYWCNGFCSPARLVTPIDFCSHGVNKSELCCAFNGTAEEYLELCKKSGGLGKGGLGKGIGGGEYKNGHIIFYSGGR